jgi:alpha-glucosidase
MLRASRDAQRAYAPDAPPFLVSRAGAAGLQRYAQTWSGDDHTSWKTLKWNLPMGLGLALSGVSNIGHDVGGFAGPPPDPELFERWMGFGVFMPRLRVHSWNEDGSVSEPWMHPEVLAPVLSLMGLRELMIPYLAAVLARYRRDYQPAVRPTFFDFPGEEASFDGSEEFMLGDLLLSAPVLEPQQSERTLRLPGREEWIDGWTGETYAGGSVVVRPAPLERPPFFLRARPPDGCPAELVSAARALQRAVRTLT